MLRVINWQRKHNVDPEVLLRQGSRGCPCVTGPALAYTRRMADVLLASYEECAGSMQT